MAAIALSKEDPARQGRIQAALILAAEVPLRTAQKAAEAHGVVARAAGDCGAAVASDMSCALHLLKAAAQCAAENVKINLGGIKDAARSKDLSSRLETALASVA